MTRELATQYRRKTLKMERRGAAWGDGTIAVYRNIIGGKNTPDMLWLLAGQVHYHTIKEASSALNGLLSG